MLRTTGLSLLLGLILLMVGLALLAPPSTTTGKSARHLPLDLSSARVRTTGESLLEEDRVTLQLGRHSIATIRQDYTQPIAAADYPYLHLALEEPAGAGTVTLQWHTVENGETTRHKHRIEDTRRRSLSIVTRELPGWTGQVSMLGLDIYTNSTGSEYVLNDFSLHGPNRRHWYRALTDDWLAYEPWNRAAMNTHTGVTQISSYYPVILSAALLFCALLAYLLLVAASRGRLHFDWRPVGLLFLACWLLLDVSWQQRLWLQVLDTGRTFAGLSSAEKLQHGPEPALVDFVNTSLQHIPPGSRVFVSSEDDYKGIRSAYYFYPNNVYFAMQMTPPPERWYRSGDFIAIVSDSRVEYKRHRSMLDIPFSMKVPVERIVSHRAGTLYKVR